MKINLRFKYLQTCLFSVLMLEISFLMITGGGPSVNILGWIIGVFSIISLLYRDQIVVSAERKVLYRFRGVMFVGFKKIFPTDKLKKIRLGRKIVKSGDRSALAYAVQLITNSTDQIFHHTNMLHSRKVAEQLTIALKTKLENRAFKSSNTRTFEYIDTPLKDSVRFEGKVNSTNENIDLAIKESAHKVKISFEQNAVGDRQILYVMLIAVFALSLFVPIFLVFLFIATPFLIYALLCFIGKSKIYIDNKRLKVRQGFCPFRQSISLEKLEEILIGHDCIYFIGDSDLIGIRGNGNFSDLNQVKILVMEKLSKKFI